jgi:hypothetical protein
MTNFRSLLKPQILYTFYISCISGMFSCNTGEYLLIAVCSHFIRDYLTALCCTAGMPAPPQCRLSVGLHYWLCLSLVYSVLINNDRLRGGGCLSFDCEGLYYNVLYCAYGCVTNGTLIPI